MNSEAFLFVTYQNCEADVLSESKRWGNKSKSLLLCSE